MPLVGTPIHYGLLCPRGKAHVESYALKDSDPLWAEAHVESYALHSAA